MLWRSHVGTRKPTFCPQKNSSSTLAGATLGICVDVVTELGAGFEEGLGLARRGRTCEASTARRSSNSNSAMSTSPPGAAAGSGDVTDSTPPSSNMRIVLVGARCAGTCGEPDRRAAPLTAAARNSIMESRTGSEVAPDASSAQARPAFGGYRATHAVMLATFQVEGSAPLCGADLSACK